MVVSATSSQTRFNKIQKLLRRETARAIMDFTMLEEGDRVMVCLSGGKDSYTLLDMLLSVQRTAPIHFEIIAVNLNQKQPNFPEQVLPTYLEKKAVPYHIVVQDTYSVVKDKIPEGKTTCSLCSRLRRGILYSTATKLNISKIALGHHRDDILETLMLNMFYGGKLKAMPPKLVSDDARHVIIRPLAYCAEKHIACYAEAMQYPIIPCNLCGTQEHLQRNAIKQMLQNWEKNCPGRVENMFRALQNVVPSHLADLNLYNFKKLARSSKQDIPQTAPLTSYDATTIILKQ